MPDVLVIGSGGAGLAAALAANDAGASVVLATKLGVASCNTAKAQGGIQAAKVLMKEGGVIACDAMRHPFAQIHPDTRAGLLETARRLDPMVLRWAR